MHKGKILRHSWRSVQNSKILRLVIWRMSPQSDMHTNISKGKILRSIGYWRKGLPLQKPNHKDKNLHHA